MGTLTSHRNSRALSSSVVSRCKSLVIGAALAAAGLLGATATQSSLAANIVLTNGNSSVTINPTSPAGLRSWTINGVNQISNEWFWFRSGSAGGQSSLDSLGTPTISLLDVPPSTGKNDVAMLTYGSSNGIQIHLTYSLADLPAGSQNSDLTENITIDNHANSTVNYHFFEYANFNLGNSTTGQTAVITNSNTATDNGNGYQVQTVVSPKASEYEAELHPTLLNEIASSSPYKLSNVGSTSTGDAEWGFEWDTSLTMCSSYSITIDHNFTASTTVPVPEPTGAAAVIGLAGLFARRPRRGADRA